MSIKCLKAQHGKTPLTKQKSSNDQNTRNQAILINYILSIIRTIKCIIIFLNFFVIDSDYRIYSSRS